MWSYWKFLTIDCLDQFVFKMNCFSISTAFLQQSNERQNLNPLNYQLKKYFGSSGKKLAKQKNLFHLTVCLFS